MKKICFIAAALLLAMATAAAQPGDGMMRFGSRPENDSSLVARYSEYMVEKYKLNDEQAAKVRELNASYVGKISFPIPFKMREEFGKKPQVNEADSVARVMRESFRNMEQMTDEQRLEMREQMQKRMEEAQEAADLMDEYKADYETELGEILDKGQLKAYKKEVQREEEREQRRREGEMRRQFERGGFGGPPGGFGGPGGGPGGFGGPGGRF